MAECFLLATIFRTQSLVPLIDIRKEKKNVVGVYKSMHTIYGSFLFYLFLYVHRAVHRHETDTDKKNISKMLCDTFIRISFGFICYSDFNLTQ